MLLITFHNDGTGDVETGHYNVMVSVNQNILEELRIEGYTRADGWLGLVERLVEQVRESREGFQAESP